MSLLAKIAGRLALFKDSRYIPFFIQRQFKSHRVRNRIANLIARRRNDRANFNDVPTKALSDLQKAGLHHLGSLLSHSEVMDVAGWLKKQPVEDGYRSNWPEFLPESDQRRPDCHVAFHRPEDVIAAPHLLALANRHSILAVAEDFLGCKPTIGYLAAWWSYPTNTGPQQAENFHRDLDDWRFLKLFVYLSDVGAKNGPHIYVQHSAHRPVLNDIRRFTENEVSVAIGVENILTLKASAGVGFIENTFGIHKAQQPTTGLRLMFQAVYCMTPLPYGPRKPVGSRATVASHCCIDLDPYVNRVYLS